MAETTKLPLKKEPAAPVEAGWLPLERMRREMDNLFEEFGRGFGFPARWSMPEIERLWRAKGRIMEPISDLVERPDRYEVTAELPGMNEKNIEVKLANGSLII